MNKLFLTLKIAMLLVSCNSISQVSNVNTLTGISIQQNMKIIISGREQPDTFRSRVDVYAHKDAVLYNDYFDLYQIGNDSVKMKTFHDYFVQRNGEKYGYFYEHCNLPVNSCTSEQPRRLIADSFIQAQWFNKIRFGLLPDTGKLKKWWLGNNGDTLLKSYEVYQESADTLITGEISLKYVRVHQMPIVYTIKSELDTVKGLKLCKIDYKLQIQHFRTNTGWFKESEVLFYLELQEISNKRPDELLKYFRNIQN